MIFTSKAPVSIMIFKTPLHFTCRMLLLVLQALMLILESSSCPSRQLEAMLGKEMSKKLSPLVIALILQPPVLLFGSMDGCFGGAGRRCPISTAAEMKPFSVQGLSTPLVPV